MKTQTLKIKVQIDTKSPYEIDTGLEVPKEMNYYYLADDYKEPTRVRLIDYCYKQSVENIILVLAQIVDDNDIWSEAFCTDLFSTKDKASAYYLNKKHKSIIQEVKDENNIRKHD